MLVGLLRILWKSLRNFVDATFLLGSDKLAADAEIEWKILLLYCYRREGGAVWNWDQREWKSNFSYRTEKWRHISCLFIFTLVYFTFVSVHVDMPHFFMLLTEIIYFVWVVLFYQYDPGHELILPLIIIVMLSSNSDCYRYIQYAAQQAVKAAERLNLQS